MSPGHVNGVSITPLSFGRVDYCFHTALYHSGSYLETLLVVEICSSSRDLKLWPFERSRTGPDRASTADD